MSKFDASGYRHLKRSLKVMEPSLLCSQPEASAKVKCMHACIHTYIHTYIHAYIPTHMRT